MGKRNYKYFLIFCASTLVLSMTVMACSVAHIMVVVQMQQHIQQQKQGDGSGGGAMTVIKAASLAPASIFLIVYTLVVSFLLLNLTSFHCGLLSSGLTTREAVRGLGTPQSGALCQNLWATMFGSVGTGINFRAYLEEGGALVSAGSVSAYSDDEQGTIVMGTGDGDAELGNVLDTSMSGNKGNSVNGGEAQSDDELADRRLQDYGASNGKHNSAANILADPLAPSDQDMPSDLA